VDDGLLLKGLSILYNKNIDNNKVKNPNLPWQTQLKLL
jgi:hypothetical protein